MVMVEPTAALLPITLESKVLTCKIAPLAVPSFVQLFAQFNNHKYKLITVKSLTGKSYKQL